MSLSDLLWACPECGRVGGVSRDGRCVCGVVFVRGEGASIEARHPDGRVELRQPAEWSDGLPEPASLLPPGAGERVREARVKVRRAIGEAVVRGTGRAYLNRIERYGAEEEGTLELRGDRVVYRPDGAPPLAWGLDELTGIQPSSSTLQVKARHQPVVSFRFPEDSVLLWEMLLHAALRAHYRRSGRGEIAEFQPRIVTR
jgi:hypothetical protein